MRTSILLLVVVVLGAAETTRANVPTPTPAVPTASPTPIPTATVSVPDQWAPVEARPAGDPATANTSVPTPTPGPDAGVYDAGQVVITVRACTDFNGDRRCTVGEGITGLPVVVVDAATGNVLAQGSTDANGHLRSTFTLPQRASLAVDVPYVGLSRQAFPEQRGIDVVVAPISLPEVLP